MDCHWWDPRRLSEELTGLCNQRTPRTEQLPKPCLSLMMAARIQSYYEKGYLRHGWRSWMSMQAATTNATHPFFRSSCSFWSTASMCMVAHLELGSTLQAFEACNVALCHLQLIVIRWNVLVFPAARSWQKLWHQLSKYPKVIWTSEKIMKMKKKQNTGDGLQTSWIDFQLQQFFRQLQALRMVSNGVHDISWLEILSTLTQSRSKADGPSDHLTASLHGGGFVQTESFLHSNTVCHHCRWDIKAILLSRAIPKGHFKRQLLESEFGIVPCKSWWMLAAFTSPHLLVHHSNQRQNLKTALCHLVSKQWDAKRKANLAYSIPRYFK